MPEYKNRICENLIPDIVNPTPDYYCTWQTQLYATSNGQPKKQREIINENSLFCNKKPYGWAYFYEQARKDLIFVMDDSWDVPLNGDPDFYGSLVLNSEKFPSFTGENVTNEQALTLLSNKIKEIGWKGLGGWVCAQESPLFPEKAEEYWTKRLKWAESSGLIYWKVDWGAKAEDLEFRKMLSRLAHRYAPSVIIENAMLKESIPYSDTYRTYDVPAIFSIPMTMEKMREFLNAKALKNGFLGIINCEDEAYIAASLGCSMGVMRNPFIGNLPNGQPDPSFPDCHRRLKTKMAEIIRAVNFHKIAPAFGVDTEKTHYSNSVLTDTWAFENRDAEIESWWLEQATIKNCIDGNTVSKTACAAISRNMELPEVTADANGDIPFVTCAKNPNGVVSIATLGRTKEHKYYIPKCSIKIEVGNADTFGIFGEYEELIISFENNCTATKILVQDLAGNKSYDITDYVSVNNNKIIIAGDIIHSIGASNQDKNDTSEPGLLLKLLK